MPGSSPDAADTSAEELLGTTDTTVADPVDTSETADRATPDSSPAPAGTMLDAVQAALEPKGASPAPKEPGPADEADPDKKPAEGEADAEELAADELKALSWKAQQRFKSLASRVKAKDSELSDLKPKAEGYDRMVGAIKRAGLDSPEVDELVELGGMLKQNPRAAYDKLLPIVRALEGVIGEVLSPQLQEQVRLGYITEEHARELQRSRAGERLSTDRAKQLETSQREQREHQERETQINASISAAEGWDKQQAAKDPDWHLKRTDVAEQVELAIVREANKQGKPYFPTAAEAVKLAGDALKEVNTRFARFKSPPREIRPSTSGASTRSKPAAKTTLDAINNAL